MTKARSAFDTLCDVAHQQCVSASENAKKKVDQKIPQMVEDESEELEGSSKGRNRQRKNQADLEVLKAELAKEVIWDKAKIKEISQRVELDQAQIYKWWWDQTRKMQRRAKERTQVEALQRKRGLENVDPQLLTLPTHDEFGGYCSRLRITAEEVQGRCEEEEEVCGSLTELLEIDVDAKLKELLKDDGRF